MKKSELYKQIRNDLRRIGLKANENDELLIAQKIANLMRELESLITWAKEQERKGML